MTETFTKEYLTSEEITEIKQVMKNPCVSCKNSSLFRIQEKDKDLIFLSCSSENHNFTEHIVQLEANWFNQNKYKCSDYVEG